MVERVSSYYSHVIQSNISYSRLFPVDPSEQDDDDDAQDDMEVDFPGQLHGAALRLDEMLAERAREALQIGDSSSNGSAGSDDMDFAAANSTA